MNKYRSEKWREEKNINKGEKYETGENPKEWVEEERREKERKKNGL